MENISASELRVKYKKDQAEIKEKIYNVFENDPSLTSSLDFIKDSIRNLVVERDSLKKLEGKLETEKQNLETRLKLLEGSQGFFDEKQLKDIKIKLMEQLQMEEDKGNLDSKKLTLLSGVLLLAMFLQVGSLFVL